MIVVGYPEWRGRVSVRVPVMTVARSMVTVINYLMSMVVVVTMKMIVVHFFNQFRWFYLNLLCLLLIFGL